MITLKLLNVVQTTKDFWRLLKQWACFYQCKCIWLQIYPHPHADVLTPYCFSLFFKGNADWRTTWTFWPSCRFIVKKQNKKNNIFSFLYLSRFPDDIHEGAKQKCWLEFGIFFSKGLPGPAGLQGPPGTAGDPGERVSCLFFFFLLRRYS